MEHRVRAPLAAPARTALLVLGVALAYLLGARLGLQLAFANRNVTAVWPPTGIAVAALLLFGRRVLPGVAVGAFLANFTNGAGVPTALLITVGNTLAPYAASLLLSAPMRLSNDLERVRDVISLVVVGGLACMTISATLGTAALLATGAARASDTGSVWFTWWLGDAMGVVLFAPFLLLVAHVLPVRRLPRRRVTEAGVLIVILAGISVAAFSSSFPLAFLVFPPVLWAAVRFSRLGAATAVVVASATAIAITVHGGGPYASSLSVTASLVALQSFNGCVAVAALVLAVITDQAAAARAELETLTADLEHRVEERTAQLRAADEAKSAYVSRISHELRTPLTVIIGYTDLLEAGETDESRRDMITGVARASEHLLGLVDDVLDMSRIESGKEELRMEPVALGAVIGESLSLIVMQAREKGLSIHADGALASSSHVWADRSRLRQVVLNLLSNAVKYSPDAGRLDVTVKRARGARTRVAVTNSGAGIPLELVPRLFEPFERLGAENTGIAGTGLGLAVSRRIIECMGGTIGLDTEFPHGASFWFELDSARGAAVVS